MFLSQRRRKFPAVKLLRALANYHVEVGPRTLPRASRVFKVRGGAANPPVSPYEWLEVDISEALKGRREDVLVSWVLDISRK